MTVFSTRRLIALALFVATLLPISISREPHALAQEKEGVTENWYRVEIAGNWAGYEWEKIEYLTSGNDPRYSIRKIAQLNVGQKYTNINYAITGVLEADMTPRNVRMEAFFGGAHSTYEITRDKEGKKLDVKVVTPRAEIEFPYFSPADIYLGTFLDLAMKEKGIRTGASYPITTIGLDPQNIISEGLLKIGEGSPDVGAGVQDECFFFTFEGKGILEGPCTLSGVVGEDGRILSARYSSTEPPMNFAFKLTQQVEEARIGGRTYIFDQAGRRDPLHVAAVRTGLERITDDEDVRLTRQQLLAKLDSAETFMESLEKLKDSGARDEMESSFLEFVPLIMELERHKGMGQDFKVRVENLRRRMVALWDGDTAAMYKAIAMGFDTIAKRCFDEEKYSEIPRLRVEIENLLPEVQDPQVKADLESIRVEIKVLEERGAVLKEWLSMRDGIAKKLKGLIYCLEEHSSVLLEDQILYEGDFVDPDTKYLKIIKVEPNRISLDYRGEPVFLPFTD